tara:strand:+ start:464 stop:595 length:132 start_codon:yes stop_codon:yes gene_type:complete
MGVVAWSRRGMWRGVRRGMRRGVLRGVRREALCVGAVVLRAEG